MKKTVQCIANQFILTIPYKHSRNKKSLKPMRDNNNNSLYSAVDKPQPAQTDMQAKITRPSTGKCCHKRRKAVTSTAPGRDLVGIHQMAPLEHTSNKQAYYSFIDPGRMKGWVGLVGWPVADGLPTQWSPVGCRPSTEHDKIGRLCRPILSSDFLGEIRTKF